MRLVILGPLLPGPFRLGNGINVYAAGLSRSVVTKFAYLVNHIRHSMSLAPRAI